MGPGADQPKVPAPNLGHQRDNPDLVLLVPDLPSDHAAGFGGTALEHLVQPVLLARPGAEMTVMLHVVSLPPTGLRLS